MSNYPLLVAASILVLVGCQNPRGTVSIPTEGPRIRVAGAPAGAVLFVDGKAMGEARRFKGDPEVLQVAVGTHLVEIRQGDQLLLSQKLFFGGTEVRTLQL